MCAPVRETSSRGKLIVTESIEVASGLTPTMVDGAIEMVVAVVTALNLTVILLGLSPLDITAGDGLIVNVVVTGVQLMVHDEPQAEAGNTVSVDCVVPRSWRTAAELNLGRTNVRSIEAERHHILAR